MRTSMMACQRWAAGSQRTTSVPHQCVCSAVWGAALLAASVCSVVWGAALLAASVCSVVWGAALLAAYAVEV
jgi:hypothetical protein